MKKINVIASVMCVALNTLCMDHERQLQNSDSSHSETQEVTIDNKIVTRGSWGIAIRDNDVCYKYKKNTWFVTSFRMRTSKKTEAWNYWAPVVDNEKALQLNTIYQAALKIWEEKK
jgi:hypothetical protein